MNLNLILTRMVHVPSLFVHLDYGIVLILRLRSVTLLALLRINLRHIFVKSHIFVTYI